MRQLEYIIFFSKYGQADLGPVEIQILIEFIFNKHLSTYSIYKSYKRNLDRPMAYKNVHKRIKRLEQIKMIQQIDKNFDRGAIHYEISTYGLLYLLSSSSIDSLEYVLRHKDDIIVKSLLLDYFEEKTIDSLGSFNDANTSKIFDYLYGCCSITRKIWSDIWRKINELNLYDILPSNEIIQKYITYLDGKAVENDILKEMADYKTRFLIKLKEENRKQEDFNLIWEISSGHRYLHSNKYREPKENPSTKVEEPPFPFNYIYLELNILDNLLYEKIRTYALFIVTLMGQIVIDKDIGDKEKLEQSVNFGKDNSIFLILKDKKLMEIISEIKQEFDYGYKQFRYYH